VSKNNRLSKDIDEYPDSTSKMKNMRGKNCFINCGDIDEEADQKE